MFRRVIIVLLICLVLVCGLKFDSKLNGLESKIRYLQSIDDNINGRIDNIVKELNLSVLESTGIVTDGEGHGSCVAIGQNLIMTAKHCIQNIDTGEIRNLWVVINSRKYEVLRHYVSDKYDIGFLRIKGRVKPLELDDMPLLLDEIYIVGAPGDKVFINNIAKGIVGKLSFDWSIWEDIIAVDAGAWWGNSGGPVFNKNGKIIGILVGSIPYSCGISVIEPVSHIKETLEGCDI